MPEHLILRLEAPLMAFGGTMIDSNGPTRDLPIVSLVTGLIANALGLTRGERDAHQQLQDRLVMGVRLDRTGTELRDFQTAQLAANDKGWTTRGVPEGRGGGANTYNSPHIRKRFYRADAFVTVALRLDPAEEAPTLGDVATALQSPARPLFIGRKPCLPSRPILAEPPMDGGGLHDVLCRVPRVAADAPKLRLLLPECEWPSKPDRAETVPDVRDWRAGVHAGENRLGHFHVPTDVLPVLDAEALP